MLITQDGSKVAGLQQGFGNRNMSSLAIVVALHVALGAALLLGVSRTVVTTSAPPPVVWLPERTPIKPVDRIKEFEPRPSAHTLTTVVDLPTLPPITDSSPTITAPPVNPGTQSDVTVAGPEQTVPTTPIVATASRDVGVACPNAREVQSNMRYPVEARRDGLAGDVVAQFVVGANGAIRDVVIASSTNRLFNREVLRAVASFRCHGQGQDVLVEAPFTFRLE